MKEFRIEQCLEDGKIREYAVFTDGSRKKLIQSDEQYGKYFEVDNELSDEHGSLLSFSFSGRIKDAIDMIRSGNGDCIKSYNLFGRVNRVIYFVDRKIGEVIRQKFLDGWTDTKFGWSVECGNKNSFSGYSMLNKNTERISAFDKERTPITFENKEEATKHIVSLIDKAREFAKRLANKISTATNEDEKEKIITDTIHEIKEYTGTEFSIIQDFTFDMLSRGCELKTPECNLDEMGYKIIQCVVS